jgi:hypothetical protein
MASIINASTSGAGGVITTADASGLLNIQTAGTTALSVTAAQDLVFSATDTSGFGGQLDKVRVVGTSGPGSAISQFRFNANNPPNLRHYASGGSTVGSFTAVSSGATLSSIQAYGSDGTGWVLGGTAQFKVDGTVSSGVVPSRFSIDVQPVGGSSLVNQFLIRANGDLQFNSGYGSVATAYGCRAWVNFNGTSNATNLTGTYSQTGTTVTVTITDHGYITGNSAFLDFTSGTAVDGAYIVTVTDANTFTVTQASRTTSGNVTDRRSNIRASGNVSSVADNGTGDYTVNFTNAMPDANYAWSGSCQSTVNNGMIISSFTADTQTAGEFRFKTTNTSATQADAATVRVSVFR